MNRSRLLKSACDIVVTSFGVSFQSGHSYVHATCVVLSWTDESNWTNELQFLEVPKMATS